MLAFTLSVLCSEGDLTLTFDPDDPESVEKARREVHALAQAGYEFFLTDGRPADAVTAGNGTLRCVRRVTAEELVGPAPEQVPSAETEPDWVPNPQDAASGIPMPPVAKPKSGMVKLREAIDAQGVDLREQPTDAQITALAEASGLAEVSVRTSLSTIRNERNIPRPKTPKQKSLAQAREERDAPAPAAEPQQNVVATRPLRGG